MKVLHTWVDRYALFAAIVVGAVGYPLFRRLTPLLPPMIFLMLFFTFCKIDPLDLRLRRWHGIALLVQLALAFGSYYALLLLGGCCEVLGQPLVAQSVMLCFLMPTAAAAPVIAGKLGGSIQNLTTFTLLSNAATAVIVPVFFPVVNPMEGMTFGVASWLILRKVGPLLLGPFLSAWLLRVVWNIIPAHRRDGRTFTLSHSFAQWPFYLWIGTIVILMGQMVDMLILQPVDVYSLLVMTIGAAVSCALQFVLGWHIGNRWPADTHGTDYKDVVINPAAAPTTKQGISRLTAGQALGQKNTTLAIWMAQTYLLPLSSVGPAAYMIVQNIVNSAQLHRAAKTHRTKWE